MKTNWIKRFCNTALAAAMAFSLAASAHAADYSFTTDAPQDYYGDTSYEAIYGSQYNYGGRNLVDFQIPELQFGLLSTTQTGVMERSMLPGLQQAVASWNGAGGTGGYGINDSSLPIGGTQNIALPELPDTVSLPEVSELSMVTQTYQSFQTQTQEAAHTSAEGMTRSDGSIGTVEIPSLGISVKVWEGESNASMKKGLGHYSSSSAWDGNVGVCGHNRGSTYVIGSIKNLTGGETITYTTIYGTRTYQVTLVETIDNNDWTYLESTSDNRITLTTCLADHPESRICVQAIEVL